MKKHTIILIVLVLLGVLGIIGYKIASPYLEETAALNTSDAKDMKGKIRIALDSWIGYYYLQSPVFKKLMREDKYLVEIIDDNANYAERMKKLKNNEIDFAVATVDSYLLNAAPEGFPGTIITVLDESKGGDAIVAWKDKIGRLEELKNGMKYSIAFTPDSPSEYLLKSIGVHFNITTLLEKDGSWRREADGAEDAYNKLLKHEVDVAVVWEPHVTAALSREGIVKLLGSEDTEKLIVDILLVNRRFAEKNSDLVILMLTNYFKTLLVYSNDTAMLKQDIMKETKTTQVNVEAMLKGVEWINLVRNAQWFGLLQDSSFSKEELVDTVESTIDILIENGDFSGNPLPQRDASTIINSSFVSRLYALGGTGTTDIQYTNSLKKDFSKLSAAEWELLRQVGTLKVRPITFTSGTSDLNGQGEQQVDTIVENIKHYPNFRILVKGHTGTRGDANQNIILSRERAATVANYMITHYNVDKDRIRWVGVGGEEPLVQSSDESSREYNDRLKRVEILLVAEN
ncbi:MAG: OmpA family protein [Spirochaetales bacterium]|nr:OmpA family protein [Spirochaetales bacterium]